MIKVKQLLSGKFASNTIWLISEKVFEMVLGLVVGIWMARYLGPENLGIINYGVSLIAFFTVICNLGIENVIIKDFINDKKNKGNILFSTIIIRFLVSVISIFTIFLIVSIIHYNEELIITIIVLQSLSLIFRSLDTIDYWFQSELASKYTVMAKTLARTVVSAWKITLLVSEASLHFFAISSVIETMVVGIILMYIYSKKNKDIYKFDFQYSKKMLTNSYHFILSGILVTLFTQMDKIMLSNIHGFEGVGIYSVASNMAVLWYFIPAAVINSARPLIMKSKSISETLYRTQLRQLYAFIIWLGIFVSIFISVFSEEIINLLYGKQYMEASIPLAILVWASTFSLLGTARNIWIVSEKLNRYVKHFFLIGIVSNFFLNLVFINLFNVVGASIATLIAQFITTLIAPLIFRETRISTVLMIQSFFMKNTFGKSK